MPTANTTTVHPYSPSSVSMTNPSRSRRVPTQRQS